MEKQHLLVVLGSSGLAEQRTHRRNFGTSSALSRLAAGQTSSASFLLLLILLNLGLRELRNLLLRRSDACEGTPPRYCRAAASWSTYGDDYASGGALAHIDLEAPSAFCRAGLRCGQAGQCVY